MLGYEMRALIQSLKRNLGFLVGLVQQGHLDVRRLMDMMHIAVVSPRPNK